MDTGTRVCYNIRKNLRRIYMKIMRSLSVLVLLMGIAMALLSSCGGNNAGNDNLPKGDYIYAPGSDITVVSNVSTELAVELASSISTKIKASVPVVTDAAQTADHEILLGKTNRPLSEKAYRALERLRDENGDQVGYVIYSDGYSIAIAYDLDIFNLRVAESRAIQYFVDKYVNSNETLKIASGRIASLVFDPILYQEEIEDALQIEKWAEFEEELSEITDNAKEIIEAYKFYYSEVCTDKVVYWLADLYDKDLGGFYFSNSGRDNEGFLPDIESTSQAVGFYKSTGMILHDADFPDWFVEEVVRFTKSLQDPDGYFYHPQWDRETLAANTQRMGRDLNSSEGLLVRFGALPTYDTPNGMKGDGILADGTPVDGVSPTSYAALTERLAGGSVVSAVSKVVPTAAITGFEMLESMDAFETYLDELAARNKLSPIDSKYRSFYQIANELCTVASQVIAKDEENGNKAYAETLISWLTEHQNKETGLYEEGLDFDNTNAYYKAINVYNTLGYPVTLADKAIESTVQILMDAKDFDNILNTFNIWGSLNQTMKNLEKYAKTPEAIATHNAAKKTLLELAPVAVRATAEAQLLFRLPDGSFSQLIGSNVPVSQMMPVAVPNTNEGNVNATTLTIGGILSSMLETMGIKWLAPTCFTEADGMRCFLRMSKLGTIIKKDASLNVEYINFDDEEVGSTPVDGITANLDGGSFTVVEAPRPGEKDNRAAMFDTALKYESLAVPTVGVTPSSTCYVFESDFCVPEDTPDGEIQVLMQNALYMTTINKVNGEVRVWESSSRKPAVAKKTELDAVVKPGEWFNLKMEFYPGDMNTVRAKIYFNGKLVAVTDNYFDDTGAKLSGDIEPRDYYEFVNIIAVSTCDMTILVDNVAAYGTSKVYEIEHGVNINIDAPAKESKPHTFDDGVIPDEFTVADNSGSVSFESFNGGDALSLTGGGKGTELKSQFCVSLPINCVASGSRMRTAVFESDVFVSSSEDVGTKLRIHILENDSERESVVSFDLVVENGDRGKVVRIVPSSDGTPSTPINGIILPTGESFKLRLEYYEHEFATLIYVDGTLLAMSKDTSGTASRSSANLLELTSAKDAGGTILLDNLKFEKDEIDFITSVTPEEESVVRDFTSLDSSTSLSGGAVIDGGTVKMENDGAKINAELTDRGVVALASRVTADILLSGRSDGTYRFAFNTADGTPVIVVDAVIKGSTVSIREYYAGGAGTTLSKTVVNGNRFTLTVKYFFSDRMAEIFIGDTHVATNTLTYLYNDDELEISNATVTKIDGTGLVHIDNLIAENTLDFALGTVAANGVMAPVNDNDFEDSYYGNPAAGAKYEPLSVGAQLGVKGLEIGKEGGEPIYSKFLSIRTFPGGNDDLRFTLTPENMTSDVKAAVFETDIYFDCDESQANSAVELYFFANDGKTMAWYSSFTFNRNGGNITVSDYNSVVGASVSGDKLSNEGKIFKLHLEYVTTSKGIAVNMFVDGEYVCSSTNMHKSLLSPMAPGDIGGLRIYTANASSGYILLDNVELYQSSTVTDTGVQEEPDNPEGEPKYHYDFTGKDWKFIQPANGFMAHSKLTGGEEAKTLRTYAMYAFEKTSDSGYGSVFRMAHQQDDYNFAMLAHFPVQEIDENANCLVFEFDMKLSSGVGCYSDAEMARKLYSAMIFSWNGAELTTVHGKTVSASDVNSLFKRNMNLYDADGLFDTKTIETSSGTNQTCNIGGDTLRFDGVSNSEYDIAKGKWHKISFEIYTDVNKVVYYLDGVRIYEADYSGTLDITAVKTNSIQFEPRFRDVDVMFDNVLSAKVVKTYSAQ